jgi:hypothetical protein
VSPSSAPGPAPFGADAADGALAPPDARGILLEVSAADPGKTMYFRVRGLDPGESVSLATGRALGAGPCVPALGGMCLELVGASRILDLRADGDGEAVRGIVVPEIMAGRTACFQAAARRGAGGSDSVGSAPVCVDIPEICGVDDELDCAGVCGGEAYLDGCLDCVGGTTGRVPASDDRDADGVLDACDVCGPDAGSRFVVQWTEVEHFSGDGGPYTFQAVLHENGDFAYYYTGIEPYALTPTIGWQGVGGDPFVELAHHTEYPLDYPNVYFDSTVGPLPGVEYVHPLEFDDIRWTGAPLGLSDDGRIEVDLGFDFPFLGTPYDAVTVLSNGVVHFEGELPGYRDENLPSVRNGAFLAVMWDDLDSEGEGEVFVQTVDGGCAQDCTGTFGGVAIADDCGDCAGGSSKVDLNLAMDCADVCEGEAYRDDCADCVGGTTGLEPTPAEECPMGPDLVVDEPTLRGDVYIDYVDVGADSCLVLEGCVRDIGVRKVIRFDTMIGNVGNEDMYLGDPTESEDFVWDECHGHYHFTEYARYDLRDLATGEVLPIGAKAGFCVMDLGVYDEEISGGSCEWYHCGNQGISSGCYDIYHNSLQCQWIDVTDMADGDYEIIVTTNPVGLIPELDLSNNTATVQVNMSGDEITLLD